MLTKSRFRDAEPCVKRAWLSLHQRELATEPDEGVKIRGRLGREFESVVRACFPFGVLIDAVGKAAIEPTVWEIEMRGDRPIFEAAFEADGMFAQVDVLEPLPGGGWHLIEAKRAKNIREGKPARLKRKYARDVGFQLLTLRRAGVNVQKVSLASINPDLVKGEVPFKPWDIVLLTDITEELTPRLEKLQVEADLTQEVLAGLMPELETNTYCGDCPFSAHCHQEAEPYADVENLYMIRSAQVTDLRAQGVRRIADIPVEWIEEHKPKARNMWHALRWEEQVFHPDLLATLSLLPKPWLFLDFEAATTDIPRYEGTKAFEVLPFQWSGHLVVDRLEDAMHEGFLHAEDTDPRRAFADSLLAVLEKAETVFVYSSYENLQVSRLADPLLLAHLQAKEYDLLKLIQDYVYVKEFNGSYSIKKVLPALTKVTYEGLAIQGGDLAAQKYLQRLDMLDRDPAAAARIYDDLVEYCKLDTLAMVEIVRALYQFTKPPASLF